MVITLPAVDHACRIVFVVRLGSSTRIEVTHGEGIILNAQIERKDETILHLKSSLGGSERVLEYRTVPDTARWSHIEAERKKFEEEFSKQPRWPKRWTRLGLDLLKNKNDIRQ